MVAGYALQTPQPAWEAKLGKQFQKFALKASTTDSGAGVYDGMRHTRRNSNHVRDASLTLSPATCSLRIRIVPAHSARRTNSQGYLPHLSPCYVRTTMIDIFSAQTVDYTHVAARQS